MATNVLPPLELSVGSGATFTRSREKPPGRAPRSKPAVTPTGSKGSGSVGVTGGGGSGMRSGGGTVVRRGGKQGAQEREKTLLKEVDPASYRHSVLHSTCTALLEGGYHRSFAELFALVEHQRVEHKNAGPAAVLLEPLIERDPTKLDQLSRQMAAAEEAGRAGDVEAVYMAQRDLAQVCEQAGDTWLSDHFYRRCLETSLQVQGDHRRKEGEANCHVGLALENRGNLQKAAGHLETFYRLTRKHKWHTASGDSLHEIACEHLRRIYTGIAEEVHSENPTSAISYLKKALEMAKEGGDSYQEGLACYRLGNAHEGIEDLDTAIQYHKSYLERCKYHGDEAGVGSAYEALARSHESKGDIENAVKFLEMFVNVTEKAGLKDSLAKACSATGSMYTTLGDYEKAVDYFGRCYEICLELDDTEALHSARVQYGIAKGHQFMDSFSHNVHDPSTESLQALVGWKDTRAVHNSSEAERDEKNGEAERDEKNGGSSTSVEQPNSNNVSTVENVDDSKRSDEEKSGSGSQTNVIARTEIGD